MHYIFNFFASAGGLGIGDFRYVSEVYKGCFHGNLILDFIAKNAQVGHNSYHMHHIFIFAAIVMFSWLAI